MADNFERVKSRLDNIQAIEPLLGALRTMSMGAWQMALNRISQIQSFEANYNRVLLEILPEIQEKRGKTKEFIPQAPDLADTIILMIGSERGLCGKFNQTLVDEALSWIASKQFPTYQIWALGSRMIRELEKNKVEIAWRDTLPASSLITYQQAYQMTQGWLQDFEAHKFNQIFILYQQISHGGKHQFSTLLLLPFQLSHPSVDSEAVEPAWPKPIIETEPKGIYTQIIQHSIASSFYQVLLRSAAAEHSARFRLMQEAKDNAEDIMEELIQLINAERKRQITQEMQELAAGAGLVDNQ